MVVTDVSLEYWVPRAVFPLIYALLHPAFIPLSRPRLNFLSHFHDYCTVDRKLIAILCIFIVLFSSW